MHGRLFKTPESSIIRKKFAMMLKSLYVCFLWMLRWAMDGLTNAAQCSCSSDVECTDSNGYPLSYTPQKYSSKTSFILFDELTIVF